MFANICSINRLYQYSQPAYLGPANVLKVLDDSLKVHATFAGDMLILVDLDRTNLSDLVHQSRGLD